MKLARVEHSRCGETDGYTYVWIPNEMTRVEFENLTETAVQNYLSSETEMKNLTGKLPNPGWQPQYDKYPAIPAGEVKAAFERAKAAYETQEKIIYNARKPFADHLIDVGAGKIYDFFEYAPEMTAYASWRHRHGVTILYGETDVNKKDKKGSAYSEEEID